MTPTEKYSEEKDELKNIRKNRILNSAFDLFSEKGIDTIAMTDIAKKAEIGVASLYRYYETKEEIAIRTSIWAWEKQKLLIESVLYKDNFDTLKGFNQLEKICSMFEYLYKNETPFLRYIYFFDSFAYRSNISQEKLIDYESTINSVKEIVSKAINKGIYDLSIKQEYKNKEQILYFSFMHTLFSTVQKLSLNQNLLNMDKELDEDNIIKMIMDLLLKSIKN